MNHKTPDCTAKEVEALSRQPGKHRISKGLYLQVEGSACSWVYRYSFQGRDRWSGLGPYPDITLAVALKKRDKERGLVLDRRDPVAERQQQQIEAAPIKAKPTFKEVAEEFIPLHQGKWTNPVHRDQWTSSLEQFVYTYIGHMPIDAIVTEDVFQLLKPIWLTRTETASRVRGRIAKVMSFAKARGLRSGENPAAWKDNLEHLLPSPEKKAKQKHHKALPYEALPAFLVKLRAQGGIAARALEFIILTACRAGDINGQDHEGRPPMRWAHVDLEAKLWTIPATKNGEEHRVPLSDQAIAVLQQMQALGFSQDLVFPSLSSRGQPMSSNAMLVLLGRMGCREQCTVHGFRSSFRDWAAHATSFPRELAEKALAHTVGDEVERAYQRGDLLNKRRRLMEAWAGYCNKPEAAIVPFHKPRQTAGRNQ